MASGKNSIRTVLMLGLLCFSAASISTAAHAGSMPCPTPVKTLGPSDGVIRLAMSDDATAEIAPYLAATNPVAESNPVALPALLTRSEISLLSEAELRERISTVEHAITSLFDRLPSLKSPQSVAQTDAGCQ